MKAHSKQLLNKRLRPGINPHLILVRPHNDLFGLLERLRFADLRHGIFLVLELGLEIERILETHQKILDFLENVLNEQPELLIGLPHVQSKVVPSVLVDGVSEDLHILLGQSEPLTVVVKGT